MLINDGETHMHLGFYKESQSALKQIETRYAQDSTVSLTARIDAAIKQVMAEVDRDDQPRDMELRIHRWTEGIEGAKMVQGNRHFNEAITVYTAMRAAWPGEQRIKELRERIIHW